MSKQHRILRIDKVVNHIGTTTETSLYYVEKKGWFGWNIAKATVGINLTTPVDHPMMLLRSFATSELETIGEADKFLRLLKEDYTETYRGQKIIMVLDADTLESVYINISHVEKKQMLLDYLNDFDSNFQFNRGIGGGDKNRKEITFYYTEFARYTKDLKEIIDTRLDEEPVVSFRRKIVG
jgi:hypothetical protein